MNLPDWGYYLMTKKTAESIFPDSRNASTLFTWFMLVKSQYKAKIGLAQNKAVLLIPTENTLYEKPFITISDLNYFAIDCHAQKIQTYRKDYKSAKLIFDFNISKPIR